MKQPALYCEDYPVLSYVLRINSHKTGNAVEKSVGPNETDNIMVGPHSVLTDNQMYDYSVTAVNGVGNTTSKAGVINNCE